MTAQEFEKYRHEAVHHLTDLNEQCENGFRLAEWPRWSYDADSACLVFLQDGIPRVIARVQLAGSTSPDGSTWTWGWADRVSPPRPLEGVEGLREFGEREGVAELTRETLAADEYLGWEMTAVAAKVLGAKGAYRCPVAGGGLLYLLYREIAYAPPAETATVECGRHGRGFPAYVCEHLAANPGQQWFSEEPTVENRWPDAWCAECDRFFVEEGEWNERNSAKLRVKLLCHRCYEGMRS